MARMKLEDQIDRLLGETRNKRGLKSPRIRLLGTRGKLRIYLVNATAVRLLSPDFTMGDHHEHNPTVLPKNEVWIASELGKFERDLTLYHELVERRLMLRGMPYGLAHDHATKVESAFRAAKGRGLAAALKAERGQ